MEPAAAERLALSAAVRRYAATRARIRAGCPLTVRELQVIGGKASGLTIEQIACLLGVTPEAVKSRTKTAYRKLRARSGCHAVAILMRDGWL